MVQTLVDFCLEEADVIVVIFLLQSSCIKIIHSMNILNSHKAV